MELRYTAARITRTKSSDPTRMSFEVVASDETVDRHGERVALDWDLSDYQKAPVVLFAHRHDDPIGRASNVRIEGGALRALIELGTTPRCREIATLVADGVLSAVSVGFRPSSVEYVQEGDREVPVLRGNALTEISLVSVPANPNALIAAKTAGTVPASYTLEDVQRLHHGDDLAGDLVRDVMGDDAHGVLQRVDNSCRGAKGLRPLRTQAEYEPGYRPGDAADEIVKSALEGVDTERNFGSSETDDADADLTTLALRGL